MKKEDKSVSVAIVEGVACFTVMTVAMNMVSPGYGTYLIKSFAPYAAVMTALTGAGLVIYALWPKRELPHKTIEKIFKRCGISVSERDQVYYPVLVTKEKTESGWFLVYSPPAGLSPKKFLDHLPEMQLALGEVEIEAERGYISVAIHSRPLKEKIISEDWLEQGGANN